MTTATSKNSQKRGQVRSTGAIGSKPKGKRLSLREYKLAQQLALDEIMKKAGG